jgi:hypothetical protein
MDNHEDLLSVEIQILEPRAVIDLFDHLRFGEMTASTECPEFPGRETGSERGLREPARNISFPWMFEVKTDFGPFVKIDRVPSKIGFPESDPASEVSSRQSGMDYLAQHCGADGKISSRVNVRKSNYLPHSLQFSGGVKLSDDRTIYPAIG